MLNGQKCLLGSQSLEKLKKILDLSQKNMFQYHQYYPNLTKSHLKLRFAYSYRQLGSNVDIQIDITNVVASSGSGCIINGWVPESYQINITATTGQHICCCYVSPYISMELVATEEIGILELIYSDLSARTIERKISQQNFNLFFHKNGFWGERLFREFDSADDKDINLEEFIAGIARIGKSSEREKIQLLFKFFSQIRSSDNEGVYFTEFVKMLYNYPKEDLKEVLSDRDFIEYQLTRRGRLTRLRRASTVISSTIIRLPRKTSVALQEPSLEWRQEEQREMASIVGEQIWKGTKEHKPHETVIKLKAGDVAYDIKTLNIQQVVRKFALKVFRDAGVDPASGKINFDQFYRWISVHRVLYQNYFQGFHTQIWELDPETRIPRFLTSQPEKKSQARIVLENGQTEDVQLRLFHGVLVACKQGQKEATAVICLEGLAVRRVFEDGCGFGLSFSHRDKIYPEQRAYFRNEALADEWAELLKFYRGESIHEKYTIGAKIGTGKFSVVYKCKHNFQQREYAVKQIATFQLDPQALDLIAHESSIMQVIQHPLLLSFKECMQTRKHIYIITEYVPGMNLFEQVRDYVTLQDYDAAKIAQMVIVGVAYLHSLEIVHRDLKPENIMILECTDSREIDLIKIIDFGFSDYLSQLKQHMGSDVICGTPNYIAPEVLRQEGVDFKIDNFAIGVIIYYMLTGTLPFNDFNIPEILRNTMSGEYSYPATIPISQHAKDLIDRFLTISPADRISLEEALRHPWFDQLKSPRKEPRKQKPKSSFFDVFQ